MIRTIAMTILSFLAAMFYLFRPTSGPIESRWQMLELGIEIILINILIGRPRWLTVVALNARNRFGVGTGSGSSKRPPSATG
jgi:hypothetical protein